MAWGSYKTVRTITRLWPFSREDQAWQSAVFKNLSVMQQNVHIPP